VNTVVLYSILEDDSMQAKPKAQPTPAAIGSGSSPTHGLARGARLRPGAPNGWRRGRVLRTLWPPSAGTQRWLSRHGAELVCVRHREDPLGLRRVVTVELVVSPVRTRGRGPVLQPWVSYPFRLAPSSRGTQMRVRAAGGRQNLRTGIWHATGEVIEALELLDWVIAGKVR
jgi:hypothetical protein